MWKAIKEMLRSKKALTMVLSIIVYAAGRLGWELSTEELLPVLAPMWGYLFGQGLADIGKHARRLP